MKKLMILTACLFSMGSLTAHATDIAQCTNVLYNMADDVRNYTDVLKSCNEIKGKSGYERLYSQYAKIARGYEENFNQYAKICYTSCDDTSFCEGTLSGACY